MSYEADFFTHYNQYIAAPTPMHPTVAFTFWWADGKTDEYFDVLIMPTRPACEKPEEKCTTRGITLY